MLDVNKGRRRKFYILVRHFYGRSFKRQDCLSVSAKKGEGEGGALLSSVCIYSILSFNKCLAKENKK